VDRVPPPGPGADYPLAAALLPLCDHLAGADDHLAAASVIAEQVLALERPTPYLSTCARLGLGLVAVITGDEAGARAVLPGLREGAAPMLVLPAVSLDRMLGLVVSAAGMADEAVAHLERAVAFCGAAGSRPEQAWAMRDLARALRLRGTDTATAARLEADARALAEDLGMVLT
jgi:hypothetical protein